jgi:plastocyanin
MAIKIIGSTIIDDSRNIVNAGVVTASSFIGDGSEVYKTFYADAATGNVYNFSSSGIGFTQTTTSPILYLERGQKYQFSLTNSTAANHPFYIQRQPGAGLTVSQGYYDGVIGSGTTVGIVTFDVPFSAPAQLWYQCSAHSGMNGKIQIVDSRLYNGELVSRFIVTNTSTANYNIAGPGIGYTLGSALSNPDLNLYKGQTYEFYVNAAAHDIYIKTISSIGTGDTYDLGVVGQGTTVGILTFRVPYEAPQTLYYHCSYHSLMGGKINVLGGIGTEQSSYTSGIITASSVYGNHYGDGSNLTGIVTSIIAGTNVTISGSTGAVTINSTGSVGGGSSLGVYDGYPNFIGVVTAIDFGANLAVTNLSAGIVTVTSSGGGGGSSGVNVFDDNTNVGFAGTIKFGYGLSATTVVAGITTVDFNLTSIGYATTAGISSALTSTANVNTSGIITASTVSANVGIFTTFDYSESHKTFSFVEQSLGGGLFAWNVTGVGVSAGITTNPTLYLDRGRKYHFNVPLGIDHPVYITTKGAGTYVSGDNYNDGVINNGDPINTGIITFRVPVNAPSILYYKCSNHDEMYGKLYVIDESIAPDANVNTSGIITASSFSGNASSATYATSAGIVTYATSAGIATYATSAGIATYATSSGIATYATSSGISTYATSAGISTYATSSGIATYATSSGIATYATSAGIATYATSAGISTYATNAGISSTLTATASVNTSGIITASSFSGSGANLTSLNASDLSTGTVPSARITASSGDFTVGQNLFVNGTLSVGGTSIILNTTQLQIQDRDIVVGYTTDANNNEISSDNTANHGGVAVASTVGSPIINIPLQAGINSNPFTYKQFMWIKQGNYSGLGTDVWLSNYAISIGNTASVQNLSRLTVGAGFTVFDTYLDAQDIRAKNINATGIITATTLVVTNSQPTNINVTGITTLSIVTAGNIYSTGIITASSFVKSSGTSSQFLKADGSVDTNTYLTSYTETDTLNSVTGRGNVTTNGISVGIATASQLDLTANATNNDSVLYLSGTPGNNSKNGLLGIGQLGFTDKNILANFTQSVDDYTQIILQNTSNTASASADIIVNNNQSAGTTIYGDFGINATAFTGGGSFGDSDGTYLYASGGTLAVGTLDAKEFRIATGSASQTPVTRVTVLGTTGLVGIGSTQPTSRLTVTGDVSVSGIVTATAGFNAGVGNDYEIAGTSVLTNNTLGSGVVNSSLTSVGTLGQLNVSGVSTFSGITTHTASLFGTTASFTGVTTTGTLNVGVGGTIITTSGIGSVGIGSTNPTAKLDIGAGTSTAAGNAPLKIGAGTTITLLTTPEAGAVEYDGAVGYFTPDTTIGRGFIPATSTFRLIAAGGAITNTIANFFGTNSNIPLVANAFYEIDIYMRGLKGSTAGAVTWTLTNSAAPTLMFVDYEQSPLSGIAAPPGSVTALTNINFRGSTTTTTAAYTFNTGSLAASVTHYFRFKLFLQNGTGTSLKIQLTAAAGNASVTPQAGSVWFARRLPGINTGTFAA